MASEWGARTGASSHRGGGDHQVPEPARVAGGLVVELDDAGGVVHLLGHVPGPRRRRVRLADLRQQLAALRVVGHLALEGLVVVPLQLRRELQQVRPQPVLQGEGLAAELCACVRNNVYGLL